MNKIFIELWQERLEALFKKALIDSEGYCKLGEPSITICYGNDHEWYAEIYSYLIDYTPKGGRHHSFKAKTLQGLIKKVEDAIMLQELIYGITQDN